MMKIKPVDGRLVRDPVTGRKLDGEVDVLDNDGFWLRRIADGDVAVVAPSTEKKTTQEIKS